MNSKIAKNRFPHRCTIYRLTSDQFTGEVKEVIYRGKCAKYGSSNLRTFKGANVIKGDYAIDIPKLIKGIKGGCYVDVEDFCGIFEKCEISTAEPVIYGRFVGTTVYFNYPYN